MPLQFLTQEVNRVAAAVTQTLSAQQNPSQTMTPALAQTARRQLAAAQEIARTRQQELLGVYESIATTRANLAQAAGQTEQFGRLEAALREALQQRDVALARQAEAVQAARAQHAQLVEGLGTAAALTHLDGVTPIVLLPVRLETRYFAADTTHYELRVRIFPDDIHIHQHQPRMTQGEADEGRRYWETRLNHGPGSDATLAAWHVLCERVGEARALWIAGALDPFQRGGRYMEGDSAATAPPFPAVAMAPAGWAEPPRARALPDRWAIAGYRDEQRLMLHWTRPVPPDLQIAPDMGAPGMEQLGEADALEMDAGLKWLTDFQTAEAVGMAARIRVEKVIARAMDRLMVFGVRASQPRDEAAQELQTLLHAHACVNLGFVAPGSPTNNTAQGKTDYRERARDHRQSHQLLLSNTPSADPDSDATRLARAFGIDSSVLRYVQHAQSRRDRHVADLFTALWPASWGGFLKHQVETTVDAATMDFARQHFVRYVRPAGLLPCLRVQAQPYGVLPVLSLARWKSRTAAIHETILVNGLRSLLPRWENQLRFTPQLAGSDDPQRTLLDVLSLSPTSLITGGEFRSWQGVAAGNQQIAQQKQTFWKTWWDNLVTLLRTDAIKLQPGAPWPPLSSRLNQSTCETYKIDGPLVALQTDKTIQLVGNFIAALAQRPSLSTVQQHKLAGAAERSLLYLLLRYAWLQTAIEQGPHVTAFFHSLAALQELSVETLESLTTDLIDASAHRLDAWISSIANLRLHEVRTVLGATGMHLGGFGWVEGLVPPGEGTRDGGPVEEDPDSAGYIHLPSLSQANTAAILYGAHLSHAAQESAETLSIDLSSHRVHLARTLLDGVHQGQPLGALLGYRLERRLIAAGLGQYIQPLRAIAPLTVGTQTAAQTTTLVVDGLVLHDLWQQGTLNTKLPKGLSAQELSVIDAALREIDDAQDALSDLLLAEGVYHATHGHAARAAAAFDAMADGSGMVLEPEVTATPASGQQVGHRVAVLLPAQAQDAWPGDAQRLRAIAEPRLNAWAADILGPPEAIRFTAAFATEGAAAGEQRSYTLADFDLCPLDVVCLAAARVESAPLLTILRLMLHAKGPDGQGFTGEVSIDAHVGAAPLAGTRSLAEAVGLAYAVARVLSASRALTPADLLVDMADSSDAESMASTLADLSARASALRTAFENLKEAFTADSSQPDAWWRAALLVGPVDPAGSDATQTILAGLAQRQAAYDAATQQNGQAAVHMTPALARITAIVGRDCTVLPVFKAANAGELAACMADQATLLEGDLTHPQRWLQDYARVRPSVEALDLALTLGELYAGPTALTVGQLPLVPDQGWIGEHLPAHGIAPRLSLVVHTPFPVVFSQDIAGLLVDAWSEVVPTATTTTGLAFHYDEPRAQAPQALLLAVPPDLSRGWTFEDLEATVRDTLDMARIRAVPAQLALYRTTWGGYLPALTLTHNLRQDLVQA